MVNTIGDICVVITIQEKMFLNVKIVESKSKNNTSDSNLNDTKNSVKLQVIEVTMQEIWEQTKTKIHKSKKIYDRKSKHHKYKM